MLKIFKNKFQVFQINFANKYLKDLVLDETIRLHLSKISALSERRPKSIDMYHVKAYAKRLPVKRQGAYYAKVIILLEKDYEILQAARKAFAFIKRSK